MPKLDWFTIEPAPVGLRFSRMHVTPSRIRFLGGEGGGAILDVPSRSWAAMNANAHLLTKVVALPSDTAFVAHRGPYPFPGEAGMWQVDGAGAWRSTEAPDPPVSAALTLLGPEEVLVSGGLSPAPATSTARKGCMRWRAGDGWQTAAPLAATRYGHQTLRLPDGLVLVAGGTGPLVHTLELYDPHADEWCLPKVHGLHPPGNGWIGGVLAELGEDVILAAGRHNSGSWSGGTHLGRLRRTDRTEFVLQDVTPLPRPIRSCVGGGPPFVVQGTSLLVPFQVSDDVGVFGPDRDVHVAAGPGFQIAEAVATPWGVVVRSAEGRVAIGTLS